MMKRYLLIISAFLILPITLVGCVTPQGTTLPGTESNLPATASNSIPGSIGSIESVLESIYARVNPSVVNIQVLSPEGSALGSGFVWDTKGDIVTNNHVVDGATRITVTFHDGTVVEASLVGADADSDLAVITVNTSGVQLQPISMADSTRVKVGQLAIAIGNPFGLQGTMTVGFISGLGRLLPASEIAVGPSYSIPDIIQTDAALNPGNSGGVLLDGTGKGLA